MRGNDDERDTEQVYCGTTLWWSKGKKMSDLLFSFWSNFTRITYRHVLWFITIGAYRDIFFMFRQF
jgi:hypothetical protein